MKVSAQYAQKHLAELLDTATGGDEIEITRPDQSSFRLALIEDSPKPHSGKRILGAGVGEMIVPPWEEWKAMDHDL